MAASKKDIPDKVAVINWKHSQDNVIKTFAYAVRLQKPFTQSFMVIDSVLSYTRVCVSNEVKEWLEANLLGQFIIPDGRHPIVAFKTEADLAFFRLAFSCKPVLMAWYI